MILLSGVSNISFQNITLANMRGMAVYIEKGDNNIFRNCTFRNIGMVVPQYQVEQNWVTKEDPGFVHFKNENFQLKGDADVFRQIPGFSAVPFRNMGIQVKTVGNPYDKLKSAQ